MLFGSLPHDPDSMTQKKDLENTVGKGENADFFYIKEEIVILATFNLWSANAFNLVMSKMLSFRLSLES